MTSKTALKLIEQFPSFHTDMIEDEMIESGFKLDEETSERMFNNIMKKIHEEGDCHSDTT